MQWVVESKEHITQGSIITGIDWGKGEDNPPLSIVLSNACDFENDKLSFIIVAALVPARETLMMTKEYRSKVKDAGEDLGLTSNQWKSFVNYLISFIHNINIGRYYFFDPKPAIDAPLLLVDFQHIMSVDIDIINDLQNEGQLDHPFVEKMMSHFVAYTGRVPSDRAEGEHEARCIQELRGEYHKK